MENKKIFLLELEDNYGKKAFGIVEAEDATKAILKFLDCYSGTKHLKTITVTEKIIIK